jgi:hypothetical protein
MQEISSQEFLTKFHSKHNFLKLRRVFYLSFSFVFCFFFQKKEGLILNRKLAKIRKLQTVHPGQNSSGSHGHVGRYQSSILEDVDPFWTIEIFLNRRTISF